MKNLFLSFIALLGVSLTAFGSGMVKLCEYDYKVDTLSHVVVGPGTTQTSLVLTRTSDPKFHLRAFYTTTDVTYPGVSVKSIVAKDKLSGGETVSSMAKRHSSKEEIYFAGINTNFFRTRGTTESGESIVGEPINTTMVDGEIYTLGNVKEIARPHFAVDENDRPVIGYFQMVGTATANGATVSVNSINSHKVMDNGITLLTPRFYKYMDCPAMADSVTEVTVKLINGDKIQSGQNMEFEVTSNPSHTGKCEIPLGECLMAAKKTGAHYSFIENLEPGDRVFVNIEGTIDDKPLRIMEACNGNPMILKAGETLDSEKYRPDAVNRHPRSGIGYTEDHTHVIMMVIDGRSELSAGAHTMELADLMRYAGAFDAINVDGGGSSALYTESLGVLNVPSDGHERAVASGMYVVVNAPEDNTITSIRFEDWSKNLSKGEVYTPKFFGYNRHGVMVVKNLQGVKLSVDSKVGRIIENGSALEAEKKGTVALTAEYNGLKAVIPVTVSAD